MHLQVKNKPIENQLSYDLILKRKCFGFARFITVNGKIFLKHIKKTNSPNRVSPLRILADLLLFEKAHLNRKIPST